MTTAAKPGQEPTPAGQEPVVPQPTPEPKPPANTDDPKALRAELERARKEAAKYRTQAREAAEEKRKATESALAEQGKHKELAEARAKALEEKEKELAELRTFKSERDQREAEERQKREAQVAADFVALPEDVRADVPDDDLRAKEIAVRTYQRAQGKAPSKPPATAAVAPAPAALGGAAKPERFTANDALRLGATYDRVEKQKLIAKQKAWLAHVQQHPEDA